MPKLYSVRGKFAVRPHSFPIREAVQKSKTRLFAEVANAHIDPLIRVYDEAGNVIETHEHTGDFKRAVVPMDSPIGLA